MIQVNRIVIDGFRAFPKACDPFEFITPIVQLNGENHQGKSSVLNAIEWCLYGDQCTGVKSGIRERKDWEIVNRNASKARVELEIKTDEGIVRIKRVESKVKGKKGKTIEVTLPDGLIKDGDNAEGEIIRLIRLSFRDFATTIYQHQESIREILIQEPRIRNDAIDRLMGLTDYRNILDGIRMSKITDVQRELVNEFNNFQGQIEKASEIRQDDLAQMIKEAKAKGLRDEELNNEELINSAKVVIRDIDNFASQLGITVTPISPPSDWKEAQSFVNKTKKELDRLWAESPDIKDQSNLTLRKNEAENIKERYNAQKQSLTSATKMIQNFEQDHGTQDKIDKKIEQVQKEINQIDKEIRCINPKAKLFEEGITLLKNAALGYPTDICPLCGKTVPNLIEHLEKEWTQKIKVQVYELKTKWENLDKKKLDLESLKAKYIELIKNVEQTKNKLLAEITEIGKFLDKKLNDKEDPAVLLKKESYQINNRLDEIKKSIVSKRETIAHISGEIERVILLHSILELEYKIDEIEKISETNEYRKAEDIRNELAELISDIEAIAENVRKCSIEEAKDKIISAETAINGYFTKITEYPGIKKLQIVVHEDKRTGANSYDFLDQDMNLLTPILSQGDFNSLALSIFLGLVKAAGGSHPLRFVLMDDPSQSLSTQQKKRLVEVLDEFTQIKNLLISTMDTELQQFLGEFTKIKTIYEFSEWDPESGPKVSKRT